MKKSILIFFALFLTWNFQWIFAQEELVYTDTIEHFEESLLPVQIFRPNSLYGYYLQKIQKLYPYALYAADVLHDLDDELSELNKKRLIRKTSKAKQKELFKEFNYMIKDLYRSEGRILMKLINRETGLTVDEIIRKYRNNSQAGIYTGMAKLFHQDLKTKYNPTKEDRIIERIIQDIENREVYFDPTYKEVTKQDYKDGMKVYRQNKKDNRKLFKTQKKEAKIKAKAEKVQVKKNKKK